MSDTLSPAARLLALILFEPDRIQEPSFGSIPTKAFGPDEELAKGMLELHSKGIMPSPVNVGALFRRLGWPRGVKQARLESLAANPPYSETFEDLRALTVEEYERREVDERLGDIRRALISGADVETVKQRLGLEIIDFAIASDRRDLEDVKAEAQARRERPVRGVTLRLPGIGSKEGIPILENGMLYAWGGRQKNGKTASVFQIVTEAMTTDDHRVLLCPLETRDVGAADQLMCSMAGVDMRVRGPELTPRDREKLALAAARLTADRLSICDSTNIYEIIAQARAYKPDLVVIDQLSHLTGLDEREHDRRTYLYEAYCKLIRDRIARALDVPVVLVFQIRRHETNRQPTEADVKDTGAIGEYCDAMVFVWRPEKDSQTKFIVELNRHGPTGIFDADFDGPLRRFRRVSTTA